jgi:hypothetical protein
MTAWYGKAGGSVGELSAKFGDSNSKIGRWGEIETGKFLKGTLGNDLHSAIFADLVPKIFKDSSNPNIDFIVTKGTSCLIIDSKVWAAGTYYSVPFSKLVLRGFPPRMAKGASKSSFKFTSGYMVEQLSKRGITSFKVVYLLVPPSRVEGKDYNLALWSTGGIEKWVLGKNADRSLRQWVSAPINSSTPEPAVNYLKSILSK